MVPAVVVRVEVYALYGAKDEVRNLRKRAIITNLTSVAPEI